jgi:hypothetical protein
VGRFLILWLISTVASIPRVLGRGFRTSYDLASEDPECHVSAVFYWLSKSPKFRLKATGIAVYPQREEY